MNEKGPKNETSIQNLLKKGARIDQNRAKIDPKGFQNKAKRDKKSQQRLQDDLGPPGGRFPGYRAPAKCHLGCQNRAKFVKKVMRKILEAKK